MRLASPPNANPRAPTNARASARPLSPLYLLDVLDLELALVLVASGVAMREG